MAFLRRIILPHHQIPHPKPDDKNSVIEKNLSGLAYLGGGGGVGGWGDGYSAGARGGKWGDGGMGIAPVGRSKGERNPIKYNKT